MMTDQELKDLVVSLAISQAKTDVQLAKTEAIVEKTAKSVQGLSDSYGGMSNHWGEEAELDFAEVFAQKPVIANLRFDYVASDLSKKNRHELQVDIFLLNSDSMAVVAVKRSLQSEHIAKFHDQTIPKFLAFYPEYKDKKLYVALATYNITQKAKPMLKTSFTSTAMPLLP